ncbi:hypothetical protein JCM8208_000684 [Rhodotorula glutinis]
MAPALFDGLYNLAAPLEGGAGLSAEMALDKHELECLAVQEVPGRSRRLKEMIDLVRSVEENETKMFKMHLDEQQTRLPAQAVLELGMVIRDTEKLVDKKKAAFAKVAHVWAHRKKMEDERGWNASFEQAADNQYINLELCRARLRALEKLAQLYRRLSRPQRASSQTLFVPGSVPVGRHKSAVPDESDVEDDPPESASRRSNTPIPHDLDHAALALAAYTPGARSDVNQAPPGQPRRASEAVRRPSIASSSPHSPSPPSNFALAAAVAASSSHTSPSRRASRTRQARDAVRGMSRRALGERE